MSSPRPLTYFSGTTTVSAATSLYNLIVAYFQANRPSDLSTLGGLDYSSYRLLNIVASSSNSAPINYGDYTTSPTVSIPILPSYTVYEQDYVGKESIDLTQRYLCTQSGTQTFSFECWR